MPLTERAYATAILLSLIGCIGCRKAAQFPGYTYIATDNGGAYYVDNSSIERVAGAPSAISFSLITKHSDGSYGMASTLTDCAATMIELEGAAYSTNGHFTAVIPQGKTTIIPVRDYVCARLTLVPIFRGDYTQSAAMRSVLGTKSPRFTPDHMPQDQPFSSLVGFSNEFIASPLSDYAYSEQGKSKNLLILSSVPAVADYSCHACGVLLSAFIIRKDDSGWVIEASEPYLDVTGSFGRPPKTTQIVIGRGKTGFQLEDGYMAQGEVTEGVSMFAAFGSKIKKVLSLETYHSDPLSIDSSNSTASKTTYVFATSQTSGFYDLLLTTSGTRLNDSGQVIPTYGTKICKLVGQQYQCA